jgi:ATP-dependent Lhr-like helicase
MAFKKLSPKLQKTLKERGFVEATLPQELGIPEILAGRNVLVIAETGSGKTESVALPVFDMWLNSKEKPKPYSILYITPLKSLNRDLLERFLWWGKQLGMDISVRHGDTSQYERRKQVEFPDDMLIVTPETLQAILPGKRLKEHLKNVKWVIVDEVHELVSSKRGVQLALGLERLRELCGNFQLISLSATVGSPKYVADFISGGRPTKVIKAVTEKQFDIQVIDPQPKKSDNQLAEKIYSSTKTAARLREVHNLIKDHTSTLAFTNTRDFAEVLASRLKQVYPDTPIENHHSSLSKSVRIDVEEKFKNQQLRSIVCTSSLELGIDIGSIDFVLQYQSPRQVSKLIQRVGRSGHTLTEKSKGTIITTDIDDVFESTIIAKQGLSGKLEPIIAHEKAYDVLAGQIVGLTRDKWDATKEEIYKVVKRAYPYRNLTQEEFIEVCKQLNVNRYIFLDPNKVKGSRKGLFYYFKNLSTIPDTKSYTVVNMISDEKVGSLDEEFVALHGLTGVTFVMKGDTWRIISVEGSKIYVEPSGETDAAIPGWEGDLMPVPYEVAQGVGRLRKMIADNLDNNPIKRIKKDYPVDDNSAKRMFEIIKKQKKDGFIPTNHTALVEIQADNVVIHTCLGTKGNETLGRFLSAVLSEKIGSVRLKTDPYRVILQVQIVNQKMLEDILLKTDPEELEFYLEKNLSESRLFQWRFIHVAKRFGVIKRDAEYGKVRLSKIIDLYSGTPVWEETLREIKTDKLNVEVVKDFLKKIKEKRTSLIFRKGLSPLGQVGIKEKSELIGSGKPDLQILDIFGKRLDNKRIRLVCLNCGEWTQVYSVGELPDDIRCPKCHAKLIGMTGRTRIEAKDYVKKKLEGKALKSEEQGRYERVKKTSDLIIVHGKKAIRAMATRGVGATTAKRILRQMHPTDKDFLKSLLKAERTYIKNKKYWG